MVVRLDPSKDEDFSTAGSWDRGNLEMDLFIPRDPDHPEQGFVSRSHSGGERNRLFIQGDGNFEDVSLVSGADFREDGRGFVLFDFDHDGWLDMGIISPQRPRFRILRNTIGDDEVAPNQAVFLNLVGGNQSSEPDFEWSARDAYGAKVLVTLGDTRRMYQSSCGEGFSIQNSKWIHVGLGQNKQIDRIDVTWPSGKKTHYENVPAGARITLFEDGRSEQ